MILLLRVENTVDDFLTAKYKIQEYLVVLSSECLEIGTTSTNQIASERAGEQSGVSKRHYVDGSTHYPHDIYADRHSAYKNMMDVKYPLYILLYLLKFVSAY